MGESIIAICDHCKLKASFDDALNAVAFLRKHAHCNFNGCRVMPEDFPCPNAQRRYDSSEGRSMLYTPV